MPKQLTNWLDEFVENGADPSEVIDWPENSGGGTSYSAGNGITITNHTISIDEQIVALKQEEFSGDYNDLENKPTIPTLTSQLQNDSGYITGVSWDDVTSKPSFATVATSGDYDDLINKPTITNVEPNTGDEPTATLNTLTVGDTVYNIPGGGSGSEYYAGDGISIDENNNISTNIYGDDSTIYVNHGCEGELEIGLYDDYKVTANSGETATATLTDLKVGDTVYDISGGGASYTAGTGIDITNDEISVDNTVAMKTDITDVEANSEETPTDTLNNLKIGNTVYDFNTTGVTNIYDHTTSDFDITYSNYRDPGLHVVHSSNFITIKSGKDSSGNVLSVTCGQSKYVLVFITSSDNSVEHKTYWYAFWGHSSNAMSYGYYDRTKGSANSSGYINTVQMDRLQNKLVTYTVTLDLTDGTNNVSADIQFTMPYTTVNFNEDNFKALFNNGLLQVAHTVIIGNGTTYRMDDIMYDSLQTKYSDLEGNLYTSTNFSCTTYEH